MNSFAGIMRRGRSTAPARDEAVKVRLEMASAEAADFYLHKDDIWHSTVD